MDAQTPAENRGPTSGPRRSAGSERLAAAWAQAAWHAAIQSRVCKHPGKRTLDRGQLYLTLDIKRKSLAKSSF